MLPSTVTLTLRRVGMVLFACVLTGMLFESGFCQESPAVVENPNLGISQDDLRRLASEAASNRVAMAEPTDVGRGSLNFLKLLLDGGALMIPIAMMSLLVVAVALERLFALRKARIFPSGLRRQLRRARDDPEAAAPHNLFEASERFPSAAARVLQDLLQKIGRPIPELESVISDGTQREADHLYGNVRWLTLAAAVTPLIGLLGTVWGMIIAFYNTTQLGPSSNKAEYLAGGIYVALVTTLGGLAVAIPAAIFAHFFEGRITKSLSVVEAELRRLVPRFESHEGKTRYDISATGFEKRVEPDASQARGGSDLAVPTSPSLRSSAPRN